jgi:K+/H+ antiporter YhaU regulatory subunit KhtT
VAELPLPDDSFLIGRPVVESGIDQAYELILLGVVDQSLEEHFVHSPGTQSMRLRAGDILVVIGPADAIEKLRRNLEKNGPPDS